MEQLIEFFGNARIIEIIIKIQIIEILNDILLRSCLISGTFRNICDHLFHCFDNRIIIQRICCSSASVCKLGIRQCLTVYITVEIILRSDRTFFNRQSLDRFGLRNINSIGTTRQKQRRRTKHGKHLHLLHEQPSEVKYY